MTETDATFQGRECVVIGAGPAGLTAAYELARRGLKPIVLEGDGIVGGIARTEVYRGYRFDMGGHRFFTKSAEVDRLWQEFLGPEFLRRPRLSRIFYNDRFFSYPLKPFEVVRRLGIVESLRCGFSYLARSLRPHRPEVAFSDWVSNRFGDRLFRIFFKSYTEKIWGIPTSELSADWAAQRIKNLSLREAALNAFGSRRRSVTSLIEEFDYPRLGPGQMWEAVRDRVEALGGQVLLNHPVHRIERQGRRITRVVASTPQGERAFPATSVISSMPLRDLVLQLAPPEASPEAEAAARLKYRAFLVVGLVVDDPQLFEDNWIYIHDPAVKVGRIQNFKNWSPALVPDAATSSVGMEYFCNVGDALWTTPDRDLVALASRELARLGLADRAKIRDGVVYRVPYAYPVYDPTYQDAVATLRRYLEGFSNLQTIGRNGLHRYNNQDHAMLTGLLAVRNMLDGEANDLWSVNAEQSYSEEIAKPDRASQRA